MERNEAVEICRKVFNHVGIMYDTEIVRCVGFEEDEFDYYYIGIDKNGAKQYYSMVGAFVSLKDLGYPRYETMEKLMHELWGVPRADEFLIEKHYEE